MTQEPGAPAGEGADGLTRTVGDLVEAVLSLGVAISRSVVRAVDGGASPGVGPADGALDEIVRNGAAAVAGIARSAVEGIARTPGTPPGSRAAPPSAQASPGEDAFRAGQAFPTVQAGGTLRVPLVIENPSPEPTGPLTFTVLPAMGPEAVNTLTSATVRCIPQPLEIAARDFEKLTVLIDTAIDVPIGRHRVRVGADGTEFATVVEFDVVH